ncbi:D-alanine--D-alanine ligase [Flavobacteriales bacterium]|jgi:D-alanine-D-alanine ligase|nr:D-alanine--D-alanine ligase [Flavobacteriales bacterium]
MKNIAVVMGGFSAEKVISIKSGTVAMNFLDKNRYNTYAVIIDNEDWRLENNNQSYPIDKLDFSVNINNQKIEFDGVFMAVHGAPGENGELQHYLDNLNIPYTCTGAKASQLSFDKGACNDFLRNNDVLCAKSIKLQKEDRIDPSEIIKKLKLPCFVKPNGNGSSFGISKVKSENELLPAIEKAFQHDNCILIESLLLGTEVTCGVHNLNNEIETFPITEIVSDNEFFDFEAKYEGKSKEITPARISVEWTKKVTERTIQIYKLLNLNGIARIDFIIMNDEPYIIEANTVPGLSEESIIPQQAQCSGMTLSELFNQSVEKMFHGK